MLENYKLYDFNFSKSHSYIYILYRDYEIVYIGMTRRLDQRLFVHLREKRFNKAKYIKVSHSEAPTLEKALIRHYKPLYNVAHKEAPIKGSGKRKQVKKLKTLDDWIKDLSSRDYSLSDIMWVSQTYNVPLKVLSDKVKGLRKNANFN